ncbi:MAG: NAD(P)/FAD-dependent oxidoreductase [Candidatus Bathyarchaeota archaeon]|nr:NAD(P)/FAD-dependent oxidoreductase [Candidatus Bathyarchaeota archaeon]
MNRNCDVLVIGAGVIGCAIARELSKFKIKTVLLEKETDVGSGVSKGNSGVLHTGLYYLKGSLKAKLCVEGRLMFPELAKQLYVPCKLCGKYVIARTEEELEALEGLKAVGEGNGVKELDIISGEELKKREPRLDARYALYSPVAGIVSPYLFTIALAENALNNGVEVNVNTQVSTIEQVNSGYKVTTNQGVFHAELVVNSAGLFADKISAMIGVDRYKLFPCRGEYLILDKNCRDLINSLVYPVPPKIAGVLGVHLTPTVDGNILIGPSEEFINEREDTRTSKEKIRQLIEGAKSLLPSIPLNQVIYGFSAVRSKITPPDEKGSRDFVIQEDIENFINLIGMESPGLTASPAIAKLVVQMIKEKRDLKEKTDFNPIRKRLTPFSEASRPQQASLIKSNPAYGEIVCRCEQVSKLEVLDSLNNPISKKTISSVKYRTRAGMGRCQGGFCLPKIVEILKEEYGLSPEEIKLKNLDSPLFIGGTKHLREGKKSE